MICGLSVTTSSDHMHFRVIGFVHWFDLYLASIGIKKPCVANSWSVLMVITLIATLRHLEVSGELVVEEFGFSLILRQLVNMFFFSCFFDHDVMNHFFLQWNISEALFQKINLIFWVTGSQNGCFQCTSVYFPHYILSRRTERYRLFQCPSWAKYPEAVERFSAPSRSWRMLYNIWYESHPCVTGNLHLLGI